MIKTQYIYAEVVLHCLSVCNKVFRETSIWEETDLRKISNVNICTEIAVSELHEEL